MKTVLLAEDNEDDVLMLKRACQRTGIPHDLRVVIDGSAAVDYLSGTGKYSDRSEHPLPDLMFLDVHLPNRNGHEVLQWIRQQRNFKHLPVVMLTGALNHADITRAYELGVTSYLEKINSPAELGQGVRIILKYWLELNVTSAGIRPI